MAWMEFVSAWRAYVRGVSPPAAAEAELAGGGPAGEDRPPDQPLILSVPPPPAAGAYVAALRRAGELLAEQQPQAEPAWRELRARLDGADPPAHDRLYRAALLRQTPAVLEWAGADRADDTVLILAELALQPVLRPFAAALVSGRDLGAWRQPVCPVCGREADVARIRPDNLRFLHCPVCDTEWPVGRLGCVWCGTDDPRKVQSLTVADLEPWRVDVCDGCGGYLKTLDQRGGGPLALPGLDLFEEDARSLPLDLLAGREGYRRGGRVH